MVYFVACASFWGVGGGGFNLTQVMGVIAKRFGKNPNRAVSGSPGLLGGVGSGGGGLGIPTVFDLAPSQPTHGREKTDWRILKGNSGGLQERF